jgi:hypothetical protein
MKMSDYNFTNPTFPIAAFKNFGLDVRDPASLDNDDHRDNCNGPYIMIDQVEFFEWCPDHFDIYGAMIAGDQGEYAAQTSITAGTVDATKGPSIITNTGKAEFIAGHFVELIPGFYADFQSVLDVSVDPNFNCSNYRNMSIDQPIAESDTREAERITLNSVVEANQTTQVLQIFPNPSSDFCLIELDKDEISSLLITDNAGKIMREISHINNTNYRLDISNLPNGIYSLIITTNKNETYHEKLIKM